MFSPASSARRVIATERARVFTASAPSSAPRCAICCATFTVRVDYRCGACARPVCRQCCTFVPKVGDAAAEITCLQCMVSPQPWSKQSAPTAAGVPSGGALGTQPDIPGAQPSLGRAQALGPAEGDAAGLDIAPAPPHSMDAMDPVREHAETPVGNSVGQRQHPLLEYLRDCAATIKESQPVPSLSVPRGVFRPPDIATRLTHPREQRERLASSMHRPPLLGSPVADGPVATPVSPPRCVVPQRHSDHVDIADDQEHPDGGMHSDDCRPSERDGIGGIGTTRGRRASLPGIEPSDTERPTETTISSVRAAPTNQHGPHAPTIPRIELSARTEGMEALSVPTGRSGERPDITLGRSVEWPSTSLRGAVRTGDRLVFYNERNDGALGIIHAGQDVGGHVSLAVQRASLVSVKLAPTPVWCFTLLSVANGRVPDSLEALERDEDRHVLKQHTTSVASHREHDTPPNDLMDSVEGSTLFPLLAEAVAVEVRSIIAEYGGRVSAMWDELMNVGHEVVVSPRDRLGAALEAALSLHASESAQSTRLVGVGVAVAPINGPVYVLERAPDGVGTLSGSSQQPRSCVERVVHRHDVAWWQGCPTGPFEPGWTPLYCPSSYEHDSAAGEDRYHAVRSTYVVPLQASAEPVHVVVFVHAQPRTVNQQGLARAVDAAAAGTATPAMDAPSPAHRAPSLQGPATAWAHFTEQTICSVCRRTCRLAHHRHTSAFSRHFVCMACFSDGLVPAGTAPHDYQLVTSVAFDEWAQRHRSTGHVLRYGDRVQLRHDESMRLLAVRVSDDPVSGLNGRSEPEAVAARIAELTTNTDELSLASNPHAALISALADVVSSQQAAAVSASPLYQVGIEQHPDQYQQGAAETWFTLSCDDKQVGELVTYGDTVRLVANRWQWEVCFVAATGGKAAADGFAPASAPPSSDALRHPGSSDVREVAASAWTASRPGEMLRDGHRARAWDIARRNIKRYFGLTRVAGAAAATSTTHAAYAQHYFAVRLQPRDPAYSWRLMHAGSSLGVDSEAFHEAKLGTDPATARALLSAAPILLTDSSVSAQPVQATTAVTSKVTEQTCQQSPPILLHQCIRVRSVGSSRQRHEWLVAHRSLQLFDHMNHSASDCEDGLRTSLYTLGADMCGLSADSNDGDSYPGAAAADSSAAQRDMQRASAHVAQLWRFQPIPCHKQIERQVLHYRERVSIHHAAWKRSLTVAAADEVTPALALTSDPTQPPAVFVLLPASSLGTSIATLATLENSEHAREGEGNSSSSRVREGEPFVLALVWRKRIWYVCAGAASTKQTQMQTSAPVHSASRTSTLNIDRSLALSLTSDAALRWRAATVAPAVAQQVEAAAALSSSCALVACRIALSLRSPSLLTSRVPSPAQHPADPTPLHQVGPAQALLFRELSRAVMLLFRLCAFVYGHGFTRKIVDSAAGEVLKSEIAQDEDEDGMVPQEEWVEPCPRMPVPPGNATKALPVGSDAPPAALPARRRVNLTVLRADAAHDDGAVPRRSPDATDWAGGQTARDAQRSSGLPLGAAETFGWMGTQASHRVGIVDLAQDIWWENAVKHSHDQPDGRMPNSGQTAAGRASPVIHSTMPSETPFSALQSQRKQFVVQCRSVEAVFSLLACLNDAWHVLQQQPAYSTSANAAMPPMSFSTDGVPVNWELGLRRVIALSLHVLRLICNNNPAACRSAAMFVDALVDWATAGFFRRTRAKISEVAAYGRRTPVAGGMSTPRIPRGLPHDDVICGLATTVLRALLQQNAVPATFAHAHVDALLETAFERARLHAEIDPDDVPVALALLRPHILDLLAELLARPRHDLAHAGADSPAEQAALDDACDAIPIRRLQYYMWYRMFHLHRGLHVRALLKPLAFVTGGNEREGGDHGAAAVTSAAESAPDGEDRESLDSSGDSVQLRIDQLHEAKVSLDAVLARHPAVLGLASLLRLCSKLCLGGVGVLSRNAILGRQVPLAPGRRPAKGRTGGSLRENADDLEFGIEVLLAAASRARCHPTLCAAILHFLRTVHLEPHVIRDRVMPGHSGTSLAAGVAVSQGHSSMAPMFSWARIAKETATTEHESPSSRFQHRRLEPVMEDGDGAQAPRAKRGTSGAKRAESHGDLWRSGSFGTLAATVVSRDTPDEEYARMSPQRMLGDMVVEMEESDTTYELVEASNAATCETVGDASIPPLAAAHVVAVLRCVQALLVADDTEHAGADLAVIALAQALLRRGALETQHVLELVPVIVQACALRGAGAAYEATYLHRLRLQAQRESAVLLHKVFDFIGASCVMDLLRSTCSALESSSTSAKMGARGELSAGSAHESPTGQTSLPDATSDAAGIIMHAHSASASSAPCETQTGRQTPSQLEHAEPQQATALGLRASGLIGIAQAKVRASAIRHRRDYDTGAVDGLMATWEHALLASGFDEVFRTTLRAGSWPPFVQVCASLILRRHAVLAEAHGILRRSCILRDSAEHLFARRAHDLMVQLQAVTLPERLGAGGTVQDHERHAAVGPIFHSLVTRMHALLSAEHTRDEHRVGRAGVPLRDTVPLERRQVIMHSLGVSGTVLELLMRVPARQFLQGFGAARSAGQAFTRLLVRRRSNSSEGASNGGVDAAASASATHQHHPFHSGLRAAYELLYEISRDNSVICTFMLPYLNAALAQADLDLCVLPFATLVLTSSSSRGAGTVSVVHVTDAIRRMTGSAVTLADSALSALPPAASLGARFESAVAAPRDPVQSRHRSQDSSGSLVDESVGRRQEVVFTLAPAATVAYRQIETLHFLRVFTTAASGSSASLAHLLTVVRGLCENEFSQSGAAAPVLPDGLQQDRRGSGDYSRGGSLSAPAGRLQLLPLLDHPSGTPLRTFVLHVDVPALRIQGHTSGVNGSAPARPAAHTAQSRQNAKGFFFPGSDDDIPLSPHGPLRRDSRAQHAEVARRVRSILGSAVIHPNDIVEWVASGATIQAMPAPESQVYIRLLLLLAAAAPAKSDRSRARASSPEQHPGADVHEHEGSLISEHVQQASWLCRAAIPLSSAVSGLLSCKHPRLKVAFLHFITAVHSGSACNQPATKVLRFSAQVMESPGASLSGITGIDAESLPSPTCADRETLTATTRVTRGTHRYTMAALVMYDIASAVAEWMASIARALHVPPTLWSPPGVVSVGAASNQLVSPTARAHSSADGGHSRGSSWRLNTSTAHSVRTAASHETESYLLDDNFASSLADLTTYIFVCGTAFLTDYFRTFPLQPGAAAEADIETESGATAARYVLQRLVELLDFISTASTLVVAAGVGKRTAVNNTAPSSCLIQHQHLQMLLTAIIAGADPGGMGAFAVLPVAAQSLSAALRSGLSRALPPDREHTLENAAPHFHGASIRAIMPANVIPRALHELQAAMSSGTAVTRHVRLDLESVASALGLAPQSVGALPITLRPVVQLLIMDANAAAGATANGASLDAGSGTNATTWLQDSPWVVAALLQLLQSYSQSAPDARAHLMDVGVPKLVTLTLISPHVLSSSIDAQQVPTSREDAGASVLQAGLQLARSLLEGGYLPAQRAFLQEVGISLSIAEGDDTVYTGAVADNALVRSLRLMLTHQVDVPRKDPGTIADEMRVQSAARVQLTQWHHTRRVLAVIQQLCEGHMAVWQNLLREQPGASVQEDVVSQMAALLADLVVNYGPLYMMIVYWDAQYTPEALATLLAVVQQAFATLTEVTQGPCVENQRVLARSRLFTALDWLWDAIAVAHTRRDHATKAEVGSAPASPASSPQSRFGSWGTLRSLLEGDANVGPAAALPSDIGDDLLDMSREAVLRQLQNQVLELLSALLEGDREQDNDFDAAALDERTSPLLRMLRSLNLDRIPRLLALLLPEAAATNAREPLPSEISLTHESSRLSAGDWDGRYSALDLCCAYLIFLKRLGLRIGLPADLSLPQSILTATARSKVSDVADPPPALPDRIGETMPPLQTRSLPDDAHDHAQLFGHRNGDGADAEAGIFVGSDQDNGSLVAAAARRWGAAASLIMLLCAPEVRHLIRVCEREVAQVEVVHGNALVMFVFRVPPVVVRNRSDPDFLERRTAVLYSVSRSNPSAKIDDFMRSVPALLFELMAYPELRQHALVRALPSLQDVTFGLALTINAILLLRGDAVQGSGEPGSDATWRSWVWEMCTLLATGVLPLLAVLHAGLAIARAAALAFKRAPLYIGDGGEEFRGLLRTRTAGQSRAAPRAAQLSNNCKPSILHQTLRTVLYAPLRLPACQHAAAAFRRQAARLQSWLELRAPWCRTAVPLARGMVSDPVASFTLAYVVLAVLAACTRAYTLFAFHLLDIVLRSALLRQTLAALRSHSGSLAATSVLWVLIMYIFALYAYARFPHHVPEQQCGTPLECVVFTMNFGLRAGGGIGDVLQGGGDGVGQGAERLLFDVAFFVIVSVVMLAIVTGVVIDAFGASRDHRNEVEQDQANHCFICGLEASQFDRLSRGSSGGFAAHVRNEHHVWHYLSAIAYLRLKDPTTYTGLESYISEKLEAGVLDWLPVGRASISRGLQ